MAKIEPAFKRARVRAGLSGQQIQDRARAIVAENPGGIRFSDLLERIAAESPNTPRNSINGAVWNLHALYPSEISKPSRGLFKPISDDDSVPDVPQFKKQTGTRESDFYKPFAEWLKDDLDEVTDVAPLGGAGMKTKWGTPDVIGVYKPSAGNLIRFTPEIVSAEIKSDPQQPVVAFGQAVACRLFSAKTYVAMPTTLTPEDQSRLESLCMLFGVGLVLFDVEKDVAKSFSIIMLGILTLPLLIGGAVATALTGVNIGELRDRAHHSIRGSS